MPKVPIKKLAPRCYMGIDPGQKGGIAVLYGRVALKAYPMPETEKDVTEIFRRHKGLIDFAYIEKVGSMPGQGVHSMFVFGQGYGLLRGCLHCFDIPFREIRPYDWQKTLGIPKRGKEEAKNEFKKRLKSIAQQMFPKAEDVSLMTADAILIAEFCRMIREGSV